MLLISKANLMVLRRGLRRSTRPLTDFNEGLLKEVKKYEEKKSNVFMQEEKSVDQSIKSKLFKNLSSIAKAHLENNPQVLKSIDGGKGFLDENENFVINEYKLSPEFQKMRDNLLSEIHNANKEEKLPGVRQRGKGATLDIAKKFKSFNELEIEDPKCEPLKMSCGGCGATLHCNDKTKPGFINANLFKTLSKRELFFKLCLRCELFKKEKNLNLITNNEDYEKNVIEKILMNPNKKLVILLIDLISMPNSIYEGWSRFIGNKEIEIFVLGSKFDLLPNPGIKYKDDVKACLIENLAKKGIKGKQIKHVELVSGKTGYNIERLISKLFSHWQYNGDVYLLGVANSGKSVMFNRFLNSDYCQILASDALLRATVSFWPNTTLNMLKFPILKITESRLKKRWMRLKKDQTVEKQKSAEQFERFKKEPMAIHAEPWGLVGTTFKIYQNTEIDMKTDVEATYALDSEKNEFVEGENFGGKGDMKRKHIEEARKIYHPKMFQDRYFFHDTPGVLGSNAILSTFSISEIQAATPFRMMFPRVIWMVPGQTLFVGGVIRIDLLESTNSERVLFSLMANPRLPIIDPFNTLEADQRYDELFEQDKLVVPYKKSNAKNNRELKFYSRDFTVDCVGNHISTADIVFSCFGWAAITSRPEIKAKIRAYTFDDSSLHLRTPSLIPRLVNMRRLYCSKERPHLFVQRFRFVAFDIY